MCENSAEHDRKLIEQRRDNDLREIRDALARIEESQAATQSVVETTIEKVLGELQNVLPMVNSIMGNPMITRMLGIKK